MINILVVGSGGREHALGWKLAQSPKVGMVYHAPGNGGTSNNVNIEVHEIEKLAKFASEKNCLTVVGPEVPLSAGIVDSFTKKGRTSKARRHDWSVEGRCKRRLVYNSNLDYLEDTKLDGMFSGM